MSYAELLKATAVAAAMLLVASTCRSEEQRTVPIAGPSSDAAESGKVVSTPSPISGIQGVSSEALVSMIARPKLWPLPPDSVDEQLKGLGPWKRDEPISEVLTLIGSRSGVVERSELSYSRDAKNAWIFVGATFLLADRELSRLYADVAGLLSKQLGKARWTRKATAADKLPSAGWRLGRSRELLLRSSPVDGEALLAIIISEPQGGPAD